jgi:fibronectin-binding autotransporter adhesin
MAGMGLLVAAFAFFALAGTPPAVTAPPTVSGTALRGQTLTAQSGSWSGTTPISFAFQWRRCSSSGGDCGSIGGATSQTYTLGSSDVGRTIRVQVTASNSAGSSQVVSSPTAVVTAPSAPANTALPALSGTAQDGHTLSVSNGSWKSDSSLSYSYKWGRCDSAGNGCSTISGATHSSYKATSSDVGHRLRATVTAKNSAGSTAATSSASEVVAPAGIAPQITARPSLTGTSTQGQTLSVCCGSWSGTQPIALAFRWVRCGLNGAAPCTPIAGATQQSYTLTATEIGGTVQAFVTATNAFGSVETSTPPSGTVMRALPVGAVRLANGRISIPVTSVKLPQRLVIAGITLNPGRIRTRARGTTVTVRVLDNKGHLVRGALVSVTGFPGSWIKHVPAARTSLNGTVKLRLRPTAKLPLKKDGALALFVRASKPGASPFAGISASRMFRIGLGPA